MRKYFFFIPVLTWIFYDLLFRRKNNFSQNIEYKLINEKFEHYLGGKISSFILNKYKARIYKKGTDEEQRVEAILLKIIDSNNLENLKEIEKIKIKIVHTPLIATFMSIDGTLFISVKLLQMCETESELAIALTHELAHYLLGHLPSKMIKSIYMSFKAPAIVN